MKIYIASSWKNQHAVEMLTALLRGNNHEVISFVEQADTTEDRVKHGKLDFDEWVWSEMGLEKFKYDTDGATESDLVIYISPSGTDAWAEVGAAWGRGVSVFGLHAKGEQAGLMRRMAQWFDSVDDLLVAVDMLAEHQDH